MSTGPTSPLELTDLLSVIDSMTVVEDDICDEVLALQGIAQDGSGVDKKDEAEDDDDDDDEDDEGAVVVVEGKEVVLDSKDVLLLSYAEAQLDDSPHTRSNIVAVRLLSGSNS